MKNFLVLTIILIAGLFVLFGNYSSKIARASQDDEGGKVRICHGTNAVTNPYEVKNVDVSSATAEGHASHTGPIATSQTVAQALKDAHTQWGDIIPPFPTSGVVGGLNWTTDGQAIYSNGCAYVIPTPEVSITRSILCGTGVRTFSGTADYHGDTSTRLKVTFDPPGSSNTTTEVNSQSEPTTWSFSKSVTVGSSYTIEAKVWDNSDGDGSPKDTDAWTFTQQVCPSSSPTPTPSGSPTPTPSGSPTPTPTPTVTPTPTPTPTQTTTNTGGSGDGRSDNLGCGSHDCSGNTVSSQGQVLGASTGPQVLGLSTTSGESETALSFIQLVSAFGFTSLGFGLFRKHA